MTGLLPVNLAQELYLISGKQPNMLINYVIMTTKSKSKSVTKTTCMTLYYQKMPANSGNHGVVSLVVIEYVQNK